MTKTKFEEIVAYISGLIKGTEWEHHCFVVGGAVRDFVMGSEIKDIDLVLDVKDGGLKFSEWMYTKSYTHGEVVTYPTYGTAMFKLAEFPEIEIECVQTRKEQYKDINSRNPETEFGTLYEDAIRRDLTINALYMDVCTGEIKDVTRNGLKDIREHRIRVTSDPDVVYGDDPLRILRCIRFYNRFHSQDKDWYIEECTLKGMYFHRYRMDIISKERIQDELNKILSSNDPVEGMRLIREVGIMKYIIPELCETIGCEQNKYHIGDVWEHTMKVLDLVSKRPYWGASNLETRMAALLHDIGKINVRTVDENGNVHFYQHEFASARLVDTILKRLKYSNNFIEEVKFLVLNHMRTKQWGDDCSKMKEKSLRKLQYVCGSYKRFFELMTLIDADNKSHAEGYCLPNQVYLICKKTNEMVDSGMDMIDYELPINGNDVMAAKDIKAGKEVGECLEYALKLAYNNPKMSKDEMLKHVKGYHLKK